MRDDSVNIRSIQHYMYCPRRYALLEINNDWAENAFVVKADILHKNVHDGSHNFSDSKKIVRSSITVYNDQPEYNIFGITDCIEFIKVADGIGIFGHEGKFKVRIVEYKPQAPKNELFNDTDAIQVFAQKISADFIWHCDSEAYIYYADVRKRVRLPFDTEFEKYDAILKKLLSEMRSILQDRTIPSKRKGQKCSGCSLSDICFPKENKYSVRNIIASIKEDDIL